MKTKKDEAKLLFLETESVITVRLEDYDKIASKNTSIIVVIPHNGRIKLQRSNITPKFQIR